jgi:hypothetical protein
VFDELGLDAMRGPDGGIDAARFPNFARLNREAAWFPRATTNHVYTREAIPSMLSGRLFPGRREPTLFERLPEGYGVVAINGWMDEHRKMKANSRPNRLFAWKKAGTPALSGPFEILIYLLRALAESPFYLLGTQHASAHALPGPAEWWAGAPGALRSGLPAPGSSLPPRPP